MMKRRQTRPARAAQTLLVMVRQTAAMGFHPSFLEFLSFSSLFFPQKLKVRPTPKQARTPHRRARTPRSTR